jgi:hypothetical protein
VRCDSPSSRQRVLRSLCCPRSLVTVWISYDSITIRVTWQARPFKLGAGLGAGLGYDQGCYNSSIRLQSGNLLAAVVASMKHAVVVAIAEIHCASLFYLLGSNKVISRIATSKTAPTLCTVNCTITLLRTCSCRASAG